MAEDPVPPPLLDYAPPVPRARRIRALPQPVAITLAYRRRSNQCSPNNVHIVAGKLPMTENIPGSECCPPIILERI